MTDRERPKWIGPVVWVVLLLVSVPILIDYADHVTSNSWAWYALAFPPLSWIALRSVPDTPPHVLAALFVVTVGISIETVALASGTLRVGRIGFVLSAGAILLLQGRLPLRATLLLALCVPVPNWILDRAAGGILHLQAAALAALSRWSGTPALALGAGVDRPSGFISLDAADAGWTAALLAFGLVWFGAMRSALPLTRSVALALSMALAAVVIHSGVTIVLFHHTNAADVADVRWIRDLVSYGIVALTVVTLFTGSRLRASVP